MKIRKTLWNNLSKQYWKVQLLYKTGLKRIKDLTAVGYSTKMVITVMVLNRIAHFHGHDYNK